MAQVRFNIGIPRGGSATRIAEDSASGSAESFRPRAGSAARDAEERKRSEGALVQRAASISLRANGGQRFEQASSGPLPDSREHEAVSKVLTGSSQAGSNLATAAADCRLPEASTLLSEQAVTSHNNLPGPLQGAGNRIRSLAQSLFFPGRP